jgi:hypothetical protein
MERQYIFFKSGRGLLVFTAGIAGIVACAKALPLLLPEASGFVIAVVIALTVIVIIASFKVDAQSRHIPKNGNGRSEIESRTG